MTETLKRDGVFGPFSMTHEFVKNYRIDSYELAVQHQGRDTRHAAVYSMWFMVNPVTT